MSFQGGGGGNGQFSWPGAPQGAPPPPPQGGPAQPPPGSSSGPGGDYHLWSYPWDPTKRCSSNSDCNDSNSWDLCDRFINQSGPARKASRAEILGAIGHAWGLFGNCCGGVDPSDFIDWVYCIIYGESQPKWERTSHGAPQYKCLNHQCFKFCALGLMQFYTLHLVTTPVYDYCLKMMSHPGGWTGVADNIACGAQMLCRCLQNQKSKDPSKPPDIGGCSGTFNSIGGSEWKKCMSGLRPSLHPAQT